MEIEKLDEAKATGEDSMSADATSPAGGDPKGKNRKADLRKNVNPKVDEIEDDVKPPQGMNEAIETIFEGHDLSEEIKMKTAAILEAKIQEGVDLRTAKLEEQFEVELDENVEAATQDIIEKLDSYLDFMAESWMSENSVELENQFKVEVAESLLDGIQNLISEHNMSVDESQVDIVSELEARLEESNRKYNDVASEVITLRENNQQLEMELAFEDVAGELAESQKDKLLNLTESMSYSDVDEYKVKLKTVMESFVTSKVKPQDQTELLEESVEIKENKPTSSVMNRYVDAIARGNRA